jgi:hypothetical protein
MSGNDPIVAQLMRRANGDPRPLVLRISENEVEPLAKFTVHETHRNMTVAWMSDMIRAGRMKFYGIPVWVRE